MVINQSPRGGSRGGGFSLKIQERGGVSKEEVWGGGGEALGRCLWEGGGLNIFWGVEIPTKLNREGGNRA